MVTSPLCERMAELASELTAAPRLLLGLDFDGTLAPLVSDPAEARMPEETQRLLEALAARSGTTVAVISGRCLEDLASRVTPKVVLGGNHGLEMLEDGALWRHPRAVEFKTLLQKICHRLGADIRRIPGAQVEDKGLTASVHYRNANPEAVPRLLEKVRAALTPWADRFYIRHGNKVIEILPTVAWNKGSALLRLFESMRQQSDCPVAVCYIGDDATDETVFHTLTDAVTIRVCEDCSTAARFRAHDIREVKDFLDRILVAGNGFRQSISRL